MNELVISKSWLRLHSLKSSDRSASARGQLLLLSFDSAMFDSHKVPVEIWMQIIDGINGLPHSEEVHYGFLRLLGRLDLMAYSKRRACGMVYNMLFRRLPSLRFTIQGDGDVDLSRHERAFYSTIYEMSVYSRQNNQTPRTIFYFGQGCRIWSKVTLWNVSPIEKIQ